MANPSSERLVRVSQAVPPIVALTPGPVFVERDGQVLPAEVDRFAVDETGGEYEIPVAAAGGHESDLFQRWRAGEARIGYTKSGAQGVCVDLLTDFEGEV